MSHQTCSQRIVPWDVSSDDPAILSTHNEYGALHYLQIHAVGQEGCGDVDAMDR
ncbi:hypothetical protein N7461_002891 [Penicillium sp. DV-2018c]|nr:hypothetical protein N7461_002891 [Penicillium sp. DV-2018c]